MDLLEINKDLSELSDKLYSSLGEAAAAVYQVFIKFEVNYSLTTDSSNLMLFVTQLLERIIATNDDEVFKIVQGDVEHDYYLYITANEYNNMYEIFVQIVHEDELEELLADDDADIPPEQSFYSNYLRNVRRSADD